MTLWIGYDAKIFKGIQFISFLTIHFIYLGISKYSFNLFNWFDNFIKLYCVLNDHSLTFQNHWVMKSKYLASLCNGWAKPANGMFQVPSQATCLLYGLKKTWWLVNAALSGVNLKNPGWANFHTLASLNLLLLFGMTWVLESWKAP